MKANPNRDPMVVLKAFLNRYPTQKAAAAALGINAAYLSEGKRGTRGFSNAMLEKLGLERVIITRKAS